MAGTPDQQSRGAGRLAGVPRGLAGWPGNNLEPSWGRTVSLEAARPFLTIFKKNPRIGCLEGSSLVTRLNCHAGDVNVDGSGVYTSRVAAPASQTLQLVIECREDTTADQILTRPAILGRSTIFVW